MGRNAEIIKRILRCAEIEARRTPESKAHREAMRAKIQEQMIAEGRKLPTVRKVPPKGF